MTTTSQDRTVIREWRDHHSDVQPDRMGHNCVKMIWLDGRCAGPCDSPSQWVARGRYLCEPHMAERIGLWMQAARKEMS